MLKDRIIFIDYLKVIGLFCIILAHVCTNQYILQIRNFDVPLMEVISGFLAIDSYKRSIENNQSIFNYYWKRISRLLIPTWMFLSLYFLLVFLLVFITKGTYPYSFSTILRSFLLLDGIGYVWIIRVYLICALLTPLFFYFNKKIKSSKMTFLILLIVYVLYELFVFSGINESNVIFEFIIAYAIPYGIIYVLGMVSRKTSHVEDMKISIIFFFIFVLSSVCIFLIYNQIQATQIMKYPPTIYYISYALFMSFLLMGIFKMIPLKKLGFIEFCSSSSLWIYLWHIFFLYVIPLLFGQIHWIAYYMMVLICSIGLCYVQNRLVDKLERKDIDKNLLKIFRG